MRRGSLARRLTRPAARRGFALVDFLAGTLILAGVLAAFTTLTAAKFEAIAAGELHVRAVAVVEETLDRVEREGLARQPAGPADEQGFRLVAAFAPGDPRLPAATGRVEARFLRAAEGEAHGLYEVRAVVRWRGPHGTARLAASTVAPLPPPEQAR